MLEIGGFPLGTVFQGATLAAVITAIAGALGIWFKYGPERTRAKNETIALQAKIEEDLRTEAALRFSEFRKEVHSLRNELAAHIHELMLSETSRRKGDNKLSMVCFVLKLVMDELRRIDKNSEILDQAEQLLEGIRLEEEGQTIKKSGALKKAERTVNAAHDTVEEVKLTEAKDNGK